MFRNTLFFSLSIVAVLTFAQPVLAVTDDDLDLTGFPEESTVVEIAQNDEGEPLQLCARPVRQRIRLAGPPKVIWVLVPLKQHARAGHGGIGFVWVKIQIPGTPPKDLYVEGIECIRKCPRGSSGTRCVENPRTPCAVCEK